MKKNMKKNISFISLCALLIIALILQLTGVFSDESSTLDTQVPSTEVQLDGTQVRRPEQPKATCTVGADGTSVDITVDKTKDADGYRIYMSMREDGEYQKIKTIGLDTAETETYVYTRENLTPGTYYWKARAYAYVNEEKVWGDFSEAQKVTIQGESKTYSFYSEELLEEHFKKHGKEMGFSTAKEYEKAASDVINNPMSLLKTEAEDGDYVYYVEDTNEFVILSTNGYIRTYFLPSDGKDYYNRQ